MSVTASPPTTASRIIAAMCFCSFDQLRAKSVWCPPRMKISHAAMRFPYSFVSADEEASDVDERLVEHKAAAMGRKHLRNRKLGALERRDRRADTHGVHQHRRGRPVEAEAHDAVHVSRFLYYLADPVQTITHV